MMTFGVKDDVIQFSFEAPNRPLSENESRTLHWATRRDRLKPWKEKIQSIWLDLSALPEIQERVGRPGTILVELPFDRSEAQWATDRRDPHNYVSTTIKAIVDQLTDIKTGNKKKGTQKIDTRLWPDDTTEYVEVLEPKLVRGTTVTVKIFPREV